MDNFCVELTQFSKAYGKNETKVYACRDIDFRAESGHITGILGPNGAGKSTLLKAICGVHYADSGTVSVCGYNTLSQIRDLCGYVPETVSLYGNITVHEALFMEASIRNVSKEDKIKYIKDAVAYLGIETVLSKKIKTLSKGFKQRVSLALALSYNPKVLVLDEFSSGLDPEQVVDLRKTIRKLAKNKVVILSTHRIEEAEELCDVIYILKSGKALCNGSVKSLTQATNTKTLEDAYLAFSKKGFSE